VIKKEYSSVLLYFFTCLIVLVLSIFLDTAQAVLDTQSSENTIGGSVVHGYKFIQVDNIDSNHIQQIASNGNQIVPSTVKLNMGITIGSFILSVLIVLFLFFLVNWGLKTKVMKFGDIIRDGSGFPSLARFQFLLWTFIVIFAVLSVYFMRLFIGIPGIPNDIPENLLILTGISIAVPFVSNPISAIKYGERKPPTGTLENNDRRSLATMLMENDKITVSRFQMFAWTWVSIIIYLGYLFSQTTFLVNDVSRLTVTDIPQIFVYLMGLSQVGYVGSKATIPKSLAVTQIIPNKARADDDVIILGTNFGPETEKGKVLCEDKAKGEAGNQIPVESIIEWKEERIHIKVPSKGLEDNNDYYIRVVNGGVISYKGGGQDDEAKFTKLPTEKKMMSLDIE
jgi:hypothetical protein